jgi:hypothetical protein
MSEKSKKGMYVLLIVTSFGLGVILPIVGVFANSESGLRVVEAGQPPTNIQDHTDRWVAAGVLFLILGIALGAFAFGKYVLLIVASFGLSLILLIVGVFGVQASHTNPWIAAGVLFLIPGIALIILAIARRATPRRRSESSLRGGRG